MSSKKNSGFPVFKLDLVFQEMRTVTFDTLLFSS